MSNKQKTIENVKDLFSNMLLPTVILDRDGSILWNNAASVSLLESEGACRQLQDTARELMAQPSGPSRTLRLLSAPDFLLTATPLEGDVCLITSSLYSAEDSLSRTTQQSGAQLEQLVRDLFTSVLGLKNLSLLYEDERGYAYIRQLNRDCYRLMKLGQNTRWYSALLTGQPAFPLGSLDLERHLQLFTSALNAKLMLCPQVTLVTEPAGQPLVISGNSQLVDAILTNLVDNCIKFSYSQQPLEIRITLRPYGDSAVITVSDNGAGLPAEYSEKVFEPFFTMDDTRRSLGLGLPVVRLAAELMGGRVLASFKDGEGASISVTLPLDHSTVLSAPDPSDTPVDYFDRYSLVHIMLSDVLEPPMP